MNSRFSFLSGRMNFQPPQVITGLPSPCVDASSAGNETRVCIDECAPTGATCDVRIDLRRCTCGGEAVQLQELRRFDMSTGAAVFFAAPSNGTKRASAKVAFFWTQKVVYVFTRSYVRHWLRSAVRLLRRVLLELARGDEGAPRQHEGALLQGGRGGDEEEGGANGKKVA